MPEPATVERSAVERKEIRTVKAKGPSVVATSIVRVFDPKEMLVEHVQQHNAPENCWVIVGSDVFNVTTLIIHHAGGPIIASRCGGDATDLFSTSTDTSVIRIPNAAYKTIVPLRIGSLKQ